MAASVWEFLGLIFGPMEVRTANFEKENKKYQIKITPEADSLDDPAQTTF